MVESQCDYRRGYAHVCGGLGVCYQEKVRRSDSIVKCPVPRNMSGEQMSDVDDFYRYDMGKSEQGNASGMDGPMIRHARQRVHMENAVGYLEAFLRTDDEEVVLGAEELRYAAREIGSISRAISVDDLLESIFRDFCIGK
jgi:tRNA modification GTPase